MNRRSLISGALALPAALVAKNAGAVPAEGEWVSAHDYLQEHADTFYGLGFSTFKINDDGTIGYGGGVHVPKSLVVGYAMAYVFDGGACLSQPIELTSPVRFWGQWFKETSFPAYHREYEGQKLFRSPGGYFGTHVHIYYA